MLSTGKLYLQVMMNEWAIKTAAVAALNNKLQTIGYNPLPADVSGDVYSFADADKKHYSIIIRTLNLDKERSLSINQREFDYVLRPDQWILLAVHMSDTEPIFYLIPGTVFATPGNVFVNNAQPPALRHFSTWEIKVFTRGLEELNRYALDNLRKL